MTKMMEWLVGLALMVAGILLLCANSRGQVMTAFTPTRFTVVDESTLGKPEVVLVLGLRNSREVWAGEAKLLVSNYRLHLSWRLYPCNRPVGLL